MIGKYKDYLIEKLKDAGIKSRIYTSSKEMKISNESHIGAVLFEGEKFDKDGSKKIYTNESELKVKRVKKYKRITKFSVTIGEYCQEKCEEIFNRFLDDLDFGIDDENGNYIEIELLDSDWVEQKDSILKSKVAVQILIQFIGGIYKDIEFEKIKEVDIKTEIEK
jgi:hypothetical protein